VITHDDRYFGLADRLVRLEYGTLLDGPLGNGNYWRVTWENSRLISSMPFASCGARSRHPSRSEPGKAPDNFTKPETFVEWKRRARCFE